MPTTEVVAAIEGLRSDINKRNDAHASVLAEMQESVAANTRKIDELRQAFPDGNVEGHRMYHEAIMQEIADRKRIRQAVLEHLLKTSTWLVILGLGGMLLASARNWIRGVVGQ